MQLTRLGRKVAFTVVTAVAILGGTPSANAAGNALCTVNGHRTTNTFAAYNLLCSGAPDMNGTWQLQEIDGNIVGTGPAGQSVTGSVDSVTPICVIVSSSWRFCKSVTLTVCVDSWCYTRRVMICIYYTGPGVKVCVETANFGPFGGDGVMYGTDSATG